MATSYASLLKQRADYTANRETILQRKQAQRAAKRALRTPEEQARIEARRRHAHKHVIHLPKL